MNKRLQAAVASAAKTGHSLFSPSGAWKYILCPGSVYMERDYESTSSKHADLGSDKHELAEIVLRKGTQADNYIGRIMTYENEVDEEFANEVQYYVDFVRRAANMHDFVAYEMRVDLSDLKGIPGEGGTADAVVVKGEHLFVIDAKFGYGKVPAEENLQLLEYAIGVYDELDALGLADDIRKVTLVIVQPQHDLIDDWQTTVEYLEDHRKVVTDAIEQACIPFADGRKKAVLNPGPKQCRWCKAFGDCPAATNVVFETINKGIDASAFDDLEADDIKPEIETGTKRVAAYNVERLAKCFAMLDYVHDWCKAVGTRMHEVIEKGGPQAGYKMVAGRKGNKAFSDADDAEAIMRAARIKIDDMFNRKLKSPTQLEKLLKGEKPKVWGKLEPLITQADGKPVVVPESDRRPALAATADQFDNLEDDLV